MGWLHCHVLGHSLGGAISSMLACAAPERVAKLALVEALGPLAGAPRSAAERLRQAVSARRALRSKPQRHFPDLFTAVRERVQHGRASGRERGGRYGLVSVVADSFKKTKEEHK